MSGPAPRDAAPRDTAAREAAGGGGPTILLVGAGGQLGTELRPALAAVGTVVARTHLELDVGDLAVVRRLVRSLRPAAIVNAAAYTAVDRAESDRLAAFATNAVAPGVLAEEAAGVGALLVHYSTDYVFGGETARPRRENDPVDPLNVYGESKLAGEHAVAAARGAHVILRTSWLYGAHGGSFVRTILRVARERAELRVVDDQTGAPTWIRRVAEATAAMLGALRRGVRFALEPGDAGVYHLAAAGATTWHGLAAAVLALDPRREEQRVERLVPVTSAEYGAPARRPRSSLLDCGRIERRFGIRLPDWRADLGAAMAAGIEPAPAPPRG